MKCPECERTGQRSKLYMPDCYFTTAMGGTETYYDEDGQRHHHEVNHSSGQGRCSNGHLLNFSRSTKCPAAGCDYGFPHQVTFQPPQTPGPHPLLNPHSCIELNTTFAVPRELGGQA